MKQRIRWICLLILTLCLFYSSLPSTVFGQEEEASLAEEVFAKYRALFQREDIQALLPPVLVGLKDPEIQPLLNAATIGLVVDNPDLLTNFIPDIDPAFVTLLKEDADLQTMLRDPLVHALLQDPAAIDELLGLLGSTLLDVVDIPDPGLRAAIAEALNKGPADTITRPEMETLVELWAYDRDITDLRGIEFATNLVELNLSENIISDISPLASLTTKLTSLSLQENIISDISPLASLTNLMYLDLQNNHRITDISPLIGLINLKALRLAGNPIEDLSPLHALLALNPELYVDIPLIDKITGPWLWMIAPTEPGQGGAASTDIDSLAVASGWTVTETDVAINGANIGDIIGNYAWTLARIDPRRDNITRVVNNIGFLQGSVNDHSSYALITLEATTTQSGVIMKVGSDDSIKVWLNGEIVHTKAINRLDRDFRDTFQVNLVAGENLLLVKVSERASDWSMFVGIDADFSVLLPDDPMAPLLDVNGDGQVNIIDLMWVAIFYGTRGDGLPADVNADGIVNVADFAAVAAGVDAANPLPQGMEWVLLAALEQAIEVEGIAAAPTGFRTRQHALSENLVYGNVAAALADARLLAETGGERLRKGVALLETLLELLTEMRAIPETTTLLPNYPNPFNPETWIPYHLANASDVRITIFDVRGTVVRQLDLGHQQEGYYTSKVRAAYWDGRNDLGESVASGVYFYQLQADNTSMLRKMLILK